MDDEPDLLRREIALLWGTDDCGRSETGPVRVVPVPYAGPGHPVDEAPTELRAQAAAEGLDLRGCRSFVLGSQVGAAAQAGDPEDLVASADGSDRIGSLIAPGPDAGQPGWTADEWGELTSGRWGPWAVTTEPAGPGSAGDGRRTVTALCHSPRLHRGAAEAGVWTRPDRRRRGLAARVTAAWAAVARSDCDLLFYSARPDNRASLATAARLGARPIGSLWQLWTPG